MTISPKVQIPLNQPPPYLENGLNVDLYSGGVFPADHEIQPCLASAADVDEIMELEMATWVPALQASRDTILRRITNHHRILVLRRDSVLVGMVAWSLSCFSINDPVGRFPRRFSDFSMSVSAPLSEAGSAFIYNVGVRASCRKRGIGRLLLQNAFKTVAAEGVSQIFLDSRMPSYNGSFQEGNELIFANPDFKRAVDRHFIDGMMPSQNDLILDQTIRFYFSNGFKPWMLLKNFIEDKSSGNIRLICHKTL